MCVLVENFKEVHLVLSKQNRQWNQNFAAEEEYYFVHKIPGGMSAATIL